MKDMSHLKKYQFTAKNPRVAIPFLRQYGEEKMETLISEGWEVKEAERASVGAIMEKTGYSHVTARNILLYGKTTK